MKNLILLWSHNQEGGNVRNPSWDIISKQLEFLDLGQGTLTLEGENELEQTRSLQVRYENKKYLLTYGFDNGEDWLVRTYKPLKKCNKNSTEIILGEMWGSSSIFSDSAIAKAAFAEFFEIGNISGEWVSS